MKQKLLFLALALGATTMGAYAQQTLTLGGYDDEAINTTAISGYKSNAYDGMNKSNAPFLVTYYNSGCQMIYEKNELAEIAGGKINSISFKFYDDGSSYGFDYEGLIYANLKLYLQETDENSFPVVDDSESWFEFDQDNPQVDFDYESDYVSSYGGPDYQEVTFTLDQPFTYTGKNLVITVVKESESTEDYGGFYFLYRNGVGTKRTCVYGSDKEDFISYVNANDSKIKLGDTKQPTPAIRFQYERTHDEAQAETTVTVGSVGYNTIVAPMSIDFTKTEGLQAFTATAIEGGYISLQEVTEAPAGTPLVVKAKAGEYILHKSEAEAAAVANNLLKASYGVDCNNDGTKYYVLSDGDKGVGFYKVRTKPSSSPITDPFTLITIPQGKAYVTYDGAAANEMLAFEEYGVVDGIANAEVQQQADDAYYSLSGVRVAQPQKGVYVHQGKKVVVK